MLPDGSIDRSFADNGVKDLDEPDLDPARDVHVAVADNNRIVVAMVRGLGVGNPRVELRRYLPTGAVDPSFAGGGAATLKLAGIGPGFALLGSRLALAGDPCCYGGVHARLLRVGADGRPDSGFGVRGVRSLAEPGEFVSILAVLSQPRGRIAVLTHRYEEAHNVYLVQRFRPSGRLDRSFGRHGRLKLRGAIQPSLAFVDDRRDSLRG